MNQRIIVRTDASKKPGIKGAGYAYVATAYHDNGAGEMYENTQYVNIQMKTTQAERRAMIFALREVWEIFKNDAGNFDLILENDCTGALNKIEDEYEDNIESRVVNFFTEDFNDFRTRWISSETMGKPHAMARETLRKGNE